MRILAIGGLLVTLAVSAPAGGASGVAGEAAAGVRPAQASFVDLLPLDDFSPSILGIYRKMMEIEDEIKTYSDRYEVDYDLTRATCMYESGGNANLTSWAGARGYFQVMPATFRSLGVATNIEAGIKYIAQMIDRFEREDYALAAYNGGPTTVGRGRAMRLESLQYVLGVGYFRTMLKLHERSIRHHATALGMTTVGADEDWWAVSRRLDVPLLQLRLHNPYLARRTLREGQLIVYPPTPREGLFELDGSDVLYRSRLGDNYFNVTFTLDADLDEVRGENSLWHLQTLPPGMMLRIPLRWEGEHSVHQVSEGETVESIAEALESTPWRIMRDNGLLWDEDVSSGMMLRIRKVPAPPEYVVHRVSRGDNLISIARRYGSSVPTIQRVNNMGRRTMIRIGERLRIPARAE